MSRTKEDSDRVNLNDCGDLTANSRPDTGISSLDVTAKGQGVCRSGGF